MHQSTLYNNNISCDDALKESPASSSTSLPLQELQKTIPAKRKSHQLLFECKQAWHMETGTYMVGRLT